MALTLGKTPTYPVGFNGRVLSTFDFDTMQYDVWVSPSDSRDPQGYDWRPGPASTTDTSIHGSPIENLLRELPPDAKWIGKSNDARGEVCVKNRQEALWKCQNLPGGAGVSSTSGIGSDIQEARNAPFWIVAAVIGLFGWMAISRLRAV